MLSLRPKSHPPLAIKKHDGAISFWMALPLFVAIFLSPLQCAYADVAIVTECGDEKTVTDQLAHRIQVVDTMRDRLSAFVTGTQITSVPPKALFTVDLDNETAIERRIAELRGFVGDKTKGLSEKSKTIIECVNFFPNLTSEANRLADVEAAINVLRLQFLSLPFERRQSLLKAQETARRHESEMQRLEQERSTAEQQAAAAERSIELAQEQAKTAASSDLRELAAQRTIIEKLRQELAQFKTRLVDNLEVRARDYRDQAQKLSLIAAETSINPPLAVLAQSYDKVAVIWRQLADEVYSRITVRTETEPLPALPSTPAGLLQRLQGQNEARDLQTAFAEVQAMHQDIELNRQVRYEEERDNFYRLLLQASTLRAQLLENNIAHGNREVIRLSDEYVRDLIRELRVVPLRAIAFGYTKFVDVRKKLTSGISGWVDVAQQLALFAILLIIPFIAYRLLKRVTDWLDEVRFNLIQTHTRRALLGETKYTTVALLLKRSVLYLPWVMMLVVLWLADTLLEQTDIAVVGKIIPYVTYYVIYRLFDSILFSLLSLVTFSGHIKSLAGHKVRLHRTTRRIGLFFLTSFIIAHITADVVGETLFYRIVIDTMIYVGLFVIAHAIRGWRDEIGAAASATLPSSFAEKLKAGCQGWTSWLFCLPTLIAIFAVRLWRELYIWLGQFDFAKRVLAEIFRRRVEGAVGKDTQARPTAAPEEGLPREYIDRFSLEAPKSEDLFVIPSSGIVDNITSILNSWIEAGGDNTLAIAGAKGSGKTTLLEIIKLRTSDAASITCLTVPPRLLSAKSVHDFFATVVAESNGIVTSGDIERKKVVLVDDAHNLFLARPGGFDGYRTLMEIVVSTSKTHFWCATFNVHSWNYLNGVFGISHGWQHAIHIAPFSEGDMRELIMKHHGDATYELAYDRIISATQSADDIGGVSEIETQFFRLLWDRSNGNPRAGLLHWLAALRIERDGRLHVSIPQFRLAKAITATSDDHLFVYAAILRHENATESEIVCVTGLTPLAVRAVLRYAEDHRLFFQDKHHRFRVTPLAQFGITQLLVGRNFLYE